MVGEALGLWEPEAEQFKRACRSMVEIALVPLVKALQDRARDLWIKRLESEADGIPTAPPAQPQAQPSAESKGAASEAPTPPQPEAAGKQESSPNDRGSFSPGFQDVVKKFATLLQVDPHRIKAVCAENARPDGDRSAVVDILVQHFDTFGASISVMARNVADAETIVESLDRASGCLSHWLYSVPLGQVERYLPGLTQEIQGRLSGRAEHWKAVALLNGLAAEDASVGPAAVTNNPPTTADANDEASLQPVAGTTNDATQPQPEAAGKGAPAAEPAAELAPSTQPAAGAAVPALIEKLKHHIQKAKATGKGFASKAEFYDSLKIDKADYYRWERGAPMKAPGYKDRIEAAILKLSGE